MSVGLNGDGEGGMAGAAEQLSHFHSSLDPSKAET